METGSFNAIIEAAFEGVPLVDLATFGCYGAGFVVVFVKRVAFALFKCLLMLGGAMMGTICGAIKGQTTEIGFLCGAGIGALAGSIVAIQLLESTAEDGQSLPKVAILASLVNGKAFMEWISTVESEYIDISENYDEIGFKGLSKSCIQKLPTFQYHSTKKHGLDNSLCCPICIEDYKEGEIGRRLPNCGHSFHVECIDQWLYLNGSCPICRTLIYNNDLNYL